MNSVPKKTYGNSKVQALMKKNLSNPLNLVSGLGRNSNSARKASVVGQDSATSSPEKDM